MVNVLEIQWQSAQRGNVRVLIDEAGAVVDLVVDDQVKILLSVVLSDLLETQFLSFRHSGGCDLRNWQSVSWREQRG